MDTRSEFKIADVEGKIIDIFIVQDIESIYILFETVNSLLKKYPRGYTVYSYFCNFTPKGDCNPAHCFDEEWEGSSYIDGNGKLCDSYYCKNANALNILNSVREGVNFVTGRTVYYTTGGLSA